jgi:murein DD-endopeptidase MepM/ murein hydrolase activator NlpD
LWYNYLCLKTGGNIRIWLRIIVLVTLILLITPQPIFAATLQQLNQQKTELQKAIDAKKKEAEAKKKEADAKAALHAQLQNTVKKLDGDINATQGRIDQTSGEIDGAQQAISDQMSKIALKEGEIDKKKEQVHESAAESYIAQGSSSPFFAILSEDRISAGLDRLADLENLSDKLIHDAEDLDRERQDLLGYKAQLEQKQQELETQKTQLAAYQRALDSQKSQKVVLADEAKQQQIQLAGQAQAAIKSADDLKKQFATISAEAAAMQRKGGSKAVASAVRDSAPPSSYGLIWPIGGVITTYFGGNTPFQNFHTGFDIAGPAGDPVKAAASGTVTLATKMCCSDYSNTVDKSYGYGNYIMIKHDNGLVTLYGHLMDMVVSPGDHVERGQTIGYRGGALGMSGAGWSTGAHLHFEVRDAQGPDDPGKYLP